MSISSVSPTSRRVISDSRFGELIATDAVITTRLPDVDGLESFVARRDKGSALLVRFLPTPLGSGAKIAALAERIEGSRGVRAIAPVVESSVTVDGLPYVAYDYDGETLREFVEHSGPLNIVDALFVSLSLAHALVDLHGRGVVHGHLTPSNVLRTDFGDLSILDVGVASLAATPTPPLVSLMSGRPIAGDPAFMAPELLSFGGAGPEADTYGVGVILYFLLTGRAPFEGNDALACATLATTSTPPSIYDLVDAPTSDLVALLDRLITKDVDERVATAEELVIELEEACRRSGSRVFTYERNDSGLVARPVEPVNVTIPRAPAVPVVATGKNAQPTDRRAVASRVSRRGLAVLVGLSLGLITLATIYLFL